ncbi:winged helix-turn-helix domain-containing protein/riboflavin kinase [Archaeoglobus sulfaticallidus]|nr:winged helix-turn-helix domain-containing protein/riboflavin kinase [Archaeoglobus sulfaticallidus]
MIEILKLLALMDAHKRVVKISSKELADKIGQSFQTAARKLKELEENGYILRTIDKDGQYIVITENGEKLLYKEYLDYKKIFESVEEIFIRGKVMSGIGEGRYYVSLDGYRKQFREKLGFDPYPGTLNLKLPKEQAYLRRRIDEEDGIIIHGFKTEDRTFGEVKAFKCKIGDYEGAIVLPQRTHYPKDILEVIAPVKLRDKLGLKDGDFVEVEVFL